ncbi:ATP-binding cassette domain-containing protein [Patescibacteria group bacterium]|nr:ATP-binding cassette domain-containing protein [Patescibacteria group bacterium]
MLHIENLERHIGNNHIINGVDLTIKEGQAIGLVGPNGCGKTSLINLINGFQKPQHGSIVFDGQHITNMSVEQRSLLGVGRVFQSFGIFKNLTLQENLALAFVHKLRRRQKWLPISYLPKEMKEQIKDILEQLELYDKRKHLA